MQDTSSDLELARQAAQGDEASFRRIYESTCDRLFSLLRYQVGDRDHARDLLQDTYVQAWKRIGDYRGEAPLTAWLRMIAIRKAIDWKRSALLRLKRTVEIHERTAAVEPDHRGLQFDSEKATFERALQKLSPMQRGALLLREWEEWDFAAIAETLGCKESTARVHHTRAREKMRELLRHVPSVRAESLKGQIV
ncbi:MAG: RNA polymerase sigma factor [Candidatus Eisenbacteria bacterium]